MTTSTIHQVFTVLTILSSIAVRVSPLPDFYRVHRNRATGHVRVLPVVLLFVLCYTLVAYAYLVNNIFPLFVVAVFGLLTCAAFIGVFYRWTTDRARVHKLFAASAVVLALFTVYVVLATTHVTHESDHEVNTVVGIVTIVCGVAMFASPLAAIKSVLRTKSAASLPKTMCVVNLVNCCLWIGYTMVAYDFFVLLPNILGALLSSIQVVLCVIYRDSKAKYALPVLAVVGATGEGVPAARERELSVVSLVQIQPILHQQHLHQDLQEDDSSHFVALVSPSIATQAHEQV